MCKLAHPFFEQQNFRVIAVRMRSAVQHRLLKKYCRAQKTIARLRAEEDKLKHAQQMLKKTTYDLGERVKELNCLYAISSIVENQANSLDDILRGTVDVIPGAWQYPDITCSRIVLDGRVVSTRNFLQTPWKQSQPIIVHGRAIGCLEVCYLAPRPEKDEGPFLKEERSLVNVLAERLGEIIERRQAQEALHNSETHTKALLDVIPDLMFQVDGTGTLLGFHEGRFAALRPRLQMLVGHSIMNLPDDSIVLPRRILDQAMTHVKRALAIGRAQVFEQYINLEGAGRDFEIRIVIIKENEVLGIVRDITFRKRLEKEIIEISGREQRRIGQDLHDSLCQQLAGIGFLCKALENRLAAGLPVAAAEATELVRHLDEAITLTRGFARGLNPVRLEAQGLLYALSELALTAEKFFGISCRFDYNEAVLIDDNSTATHLYRIVQEALNNAIKHGGATRVVISLRTDGKTHTLTVRDNGSGIPPVTGQGPGMGLNIMKYRASMIGATLDIKNHGEGGALVSCSFQGITEADPLSI